MHLQVLAILRYRIFLEGKLHEEDVDESSYQRNGKDGNLKLQADDGDIVIKLNK